MQTLTINIKEPKTSEKVIWFLKHLENDGVELMQQEDLADLKHIAATRGEPTVSFDEYLKNEN
jgi:hypothetical protein